VRQIPSKLPESPQDIGLSDRRAKRCMPPRGVKSIPVTEYQKNAADREAWMREKQARKKLARRKNEAKIIRDANAVPTSPDQRRAVKEREEAIRMAEVEWKRENQLLAEADAEIRRRRMDEAARGLSGTVNKEGPDSKDGAVDGE
jgi:hypothetical protein